MHDPSFVRPQRLSRNALPFHRALAAAARHGADLSKLARIVRIVLNLNHFHSAGTRKWALRTTRWISAARYADGSSWHRVWTDTDVLAGGGHAAFVRVCALKDTTLQETGLAGRGLVAGHSRASGLKDNPSTVACLERRTYLRELDVSSAFECSLLSPGTARCMSVKARTARR